MLAEATNAEVRAFHSYDPRIAVATATANAYIPVSLPFDEIEKQMHEQHEKRFNEVVTFHGIDADKSHLVSGVTHEELPKFSNSVAADVVIMGRGLEESVETSVCWCHGRANTRTLALRPSDRQT